MATPNITSITHLANTYLEKKQDRKLLSLLVKKDFHIIAQVIDNLESGKKKTFGLLPPEIQAQVLLVLSDSSTRFIVPRLSDYTLARILHFNDDDDAVDILQFLPHTRRAAILDKLKERKRLRIEKLIKYHPETAGGLMDLNFIIVKPDYTLKDVADKVDSHVTKHRQAPLIVVVDEQAKIKGYIPYKNLIFRTTRDKVKTLTQKLPTISYKTDQEQILRFILNNRTEITGVVDNENRILGIIHARDLIRVVQTEATEDVYRFAGVSTEEDVLDSPRLAVRRRYRWLILNLATGFVAAFVVSLFEATIAEMAILAVFMPIVAGMGGNTGTQSLAVVVRGIALGEVSWSNGKRVLKKETIAGMINGLIVGIIAAIVATLLSGSPALGIVLGVAMLGTMILAGFFGALIPLMLRSFKVDPAVASSVFVTTATDVFGFFLFLFLASVVLL